MKIRDNINPQILPLIDEVLNQGLRVFVLKSKTHPSSGGIDFAYVCQETHGSFAIINAGLTEKDELTLAAPVAPDRAYGSSVLIDHGYSVHGQVQALKAVCASPTVRVRFMGTLAPVVPNFGLQALTRWRGGVSSFIEVTTTNLMQDLSASAEFTREITPDRKNELSHV